jgi:predicted metal-dependent peptidase
LFRHLTDKTFISSTYGNPLLANIAMDLEINSYISGLPEGGYTPSREQKVQKTDLSGELLFDGNGYPVFVESPLSEWTKKIRPALGSDQYMKLLLELMKKDPKIEEYMDQLGSGGGLHGSNIGDHRHWSNDEGPEEGETEEEYHARTSREADSFNGMVDATLKDAVQRAIQTNQWGNTSKEIQQKILSLFEYTVPWQTVVRRFLGHSVPAEYRTTYNRINRRMPGLLPGRTVSYKPFFHIYIDQSGSVGDDMLTRFFSELTGLARNETFMVHYFDTSVKPGKVWKKGMSCPLDRELMGGTCFDAPTQHALESRCDGFFILTDGFAARPIAVPRSSRKRRAWIIGEGCPIPEWMSNFPQDVVVTLDNKSSELVNT